MPNPIVSEVFACGICGAPVALIALPGGDLAYECQSPRCRKAVSVDAPEALALVEDVAIELPAPRVKVVA